VAAKEGKPPIVFITLVDDHVRSIVTGERCDGFVMDLFSAFVEPLEKEFGVKSNHRIGRFTMPARARVRRPHRGHQLAADAATTTARCFRNLDIAESVWGVTAVDGLDAVVVLALLLASVKRPMRWFDLTPNSFSTRFDEGRNRSSRSVAALAGDRCCARGRRRA